MKSVELKMVDISKYFPEENVKRIAHGIVLYEFDASRKEEFIAEMLIPMREAFLSEEQLNAELASEPNREEIIRDYLPTAPEMKSADFGEALGYYFAYSIFKPTPNVCPFKLRYLNGANKPSPYTDIVFFYSESPDYCSHNDVRYSVEVKTRATNPGSESSIEEAIVHAHKDEVSRAAETVPYLKAKIRAHKEPVEMYKIVKRFGEDAYQDIFQKSSNALAVVDKSFLQKHIDNITTETKDKLRKDYAKIHIFCMPIEELKMLYEKFYELMPIRT